VSSGLLKSWRRLFSKAAGPSLAETVRERQAACERLPDDALKQALGGATDLPEVVAVTAAVIRRVLGLDLFDVQVRGALALAAGRIAEMKTGEGKTLAAVPAVVWYARGGAGVHVLTANDYLARRDAAWMGPIYDFLGLSVGTVQQGLSPKDRQDAYRRDVTYATATEVGFDLLRDGLARQLEEQVLRPFATAVVDEADMILIDEARIPLVIAGGTAPPDDQAARADEAVRGLRRGAHYEVDRHGREVSLTDEGIRVVEAVLRCPNLYAEGQLELYTAVQNALHAHALLQRDVDYVVKDDTVLSVDEMKGRVVPGRRWPAGLHTALEAKEGVTRKRQGAVLGSITLQNLIGLYPRVCGMTGTAASQREELRDIYELDVEEIPTHRPVIRVDHDDEVFERRADKETAVLADIRRVHESGRPVLVGTSSVSESERLSRSLSDLPHSVLNARNEEAEAGIIEHAGEPGAITISTNMAGRGVDIRLGPGVAERGGLHVIGTNRHASRRIDDQLRGRAGRQGDPGSSRFFVSSEDDLFARHAEPGPATTADELQRVIEGRNLDLRLFLQKYESIIEGQRQIIEAWRQDMLAGESAGLERLVTLALIDEAWSEHLAAVTELREGTVWTALGGGAAHQEYLTRVHELFVALRPRVENEVPERVAQAASGEWDPARPGATWTYLTTDQPFGSMSERFMKGLWRRVRGKSGPNAAG
jgi:preprotein translocase subunit SecA